jgi:hypothetical protein
LWFAAGLPPYWHKRAKSKTHGFDKANFKKQVDIYRDSHADMLLAVRQETLKAAGLPDDATKLDESSRQTIRKYLQTADWTHVYFRRMTEPFGPWRQAQIIDMCARLNSAAFEFDTSVLDLILNAGYNPKAHRGDVFDHSLLTYLADPGLTFITADQKLKGRIRRSSQGRRIVALAPGEGSSPFGGVKVGSGL